MDRRAFIKLTAITGTSATLASCGSPENELIRFLPDEELVPGVAVWKPSICPSCPSGCGLQVRVMDADVDVIRNNQAGVVRRGVAKKLEGLPGHPVNQGALCARGQAAIQTTYHPDRITQPLKCAGNRGDGRFEAISWDDALAEVVTRLNGLEAESRPKPLAFLGRRGTGQRYALVATFLDRIGAPPPVTFDLFGDQVLRRGNALIFGRSQLPTFDLPNARYVLSFGADFLGTWNSPVSQSVGYGSMRQGRPGVRGSFVQVEARMSQTGANADAWVPTTPGTEGVLALGLAHVIMRDVFDRPDATSRAAALIEGWADGLPRWAPEQVEHLTGVRADRIERLAAEFATERPAVAIIGGPPLAHTNGLFNAVAVNALNALVGSVGEPGGLFFTPQSPLDGPTRQVEAPRSLEALASGILSRESPVQVLMVDGANPVFSAPPAWNVRAALERVPLIVSFGSFVDETSILADLILPDHSFLESWVDAVPESGSLVPVTGVAAPVMQPLYHTRATPDVLLDIARRLQQPLDLPWETFEAMLEASFADLPPGETGGESWTEARIRGGWWGWPSAAGSAAPSDPAPAPVPYAAPQFDGEAEEYPFHFLPYASAAFLDGSLAHLPWLQELPDPLTSAMWSSWVEINPRTAERLGIAQGDAVEIASRHGTLRAPALVSPGLAPDIVAMPAGQGHETFTRFASGRGANPATLLAPMADSGTGALAWAATRVRVSRVDESETRVILFAGSLREHGMDDEGVRSR